jgi:hypothetical protein
LHSVQRRFSSSDRIRELRRMRWRNYSESRPFILRGVRRWKVQLSGSIDVLDLRRGNLLGVTVERVLVVLKWDVQSGRFFSLFRLRGREEERNRCTFLHRL